MSVEENFQRHSIVPGRIEDVPTGLSDKILSEITAKHQNRDKKEIKGIPTKLSDQTLDSIAPGFSCCQK